MTKATTVQARIEPDLKKIRKQGKNLLLLQEILALLCQSQSLPKKNSDHPLVGN